MILCIYVNCCLLCQVVGQLGKSCMFDTFIFTKQTLFIWHFHSTWHVGQASIDAVYWYSSLSGFLTVLPYLVLIMFSPFFILSLSPLASLDIFCIYSCLFPCGLFLAPWSPCVTWLSLLLLWVLQYDCGLFSIWSSMASSGSVCLFVCFLALYCMYSSGVMDVGLMCCLLHVLFFCICD